MTNNNRTVTTIDRLTDREWDVVCTIRQLFPDIDGANEGVGINVDALTYYAAVGVDPNDEDACRAALTELRRLSCYDITVTKAFPHSDGTSTIVPGTIELLGVRPSWLASRLPFTLTETWGQWYGPDAPWTGPLPVILTLTMRAALMKAIDAWNEQVA